MDRASYTLNLGVDKPLYDTYIYCQNFEPGHEKCSL